jgi:hypothetical protein
VAAAVTPPKKRPFPVPWGLFIALGIYALAVLGYVWATYWRSPEYQAAQHYAEALHLLGVDDGRKCSQQQLERAMDHVLEAARLMPRIKPLAEHAERLRWRFEERHFKLDEGMKMRSEAVSALARRVEQEKEPWLVIGTHDKGWAAEQLLEGPQKAVWWSIPGGVVVVLVWGYLRFSAKAVREREHEQDLRSREAEVEEIGKYRSGLEKRAADTLDDEVEDTVSEATPADVPKRPAAKPPPSAGRSGVKRKPPT